MTPRRIVLAALGFVFLVSAIILMCRRGLAKDAYLDDRLRPGELSSIERDLPRAEWAYANKALADCAFRSFFARVRDITFGRIYHVYRPFNGYVVVESGWVWSSRPTQTYDLVLTRNGW